MKKSISFTTDEWVAIAAALRCSEERYREWSLTIVNSGVADRFAKQGRKALQLSERIEAQIGI